jgi:hypothetical protein
MISINNTICIRQVTQITWAQRGLIIIITSSNRNKIMLLIIDMLIWAMKNLSKKIKISSKKFLTIKMEVLYSINNWPVEQIARQIFLTLRKTGNCPNSCKHTRIRTVQISATYRYKTYLQEILTMVDWEEEEAGLQRWIRRTRSIWLSLSTQIWHKWWSCPISTSSEEGKMAPMQWCRM